MFDPRLRAILDLSVPRARLDAGRHEYDGITQDLSPTTITTALTHLTQPTTRYPDAHDEAQAHRAHAGRDEDTGRYADAHDEAHASAAERALRVTFGELELHRVNPMLHIENLELDCYDRDYAPAAERAAARLRHLEYWPDAIDAAIQSLDRMPLSIAQAVLPSAHGLSAYLDPHVLATPPGHSAPYGDGGGVGLTAAQEQVVERARVALGRFVRHLETAGVPDAPLLGEDGLAKLLGASEAIDVDLAALAARAESERDRLREMLAEACARLAPDQSIAETLDRLDDDHPSADDLIEWTRDLVGTV